MKDNLEDIGYWCFNHDEENSYAGTFKNESGEISVILMGCTGGPQEPFIVHGSTATGKKITLYQCHVSSVRRSFPGIPSVEVSATYCFTGGHLTANNLVFNSALLKVSSINEWVDIGGFSDLQDNEETFSIKYKNPEPIVFYETDEVKFVLLFYRTSPFFKPTHKCTVVQETLILIEPKTTFGLDKFWEYTSMIQGFLTLAYFSEPKLLDIRFRQKEIDFTFNYLGKSKDDEENKKNKRSFLFTHRIIQSDFINIFRKWAGLSLAIEPVISIVVESFRNRTVISENKFLNVMQGIETFHRRRRNNEREPTGAHKAKVSDILKFCPVDHISWLKDRLNFSNEPTLQERFTKLFSELDDGIKNHLFPKFSEIIRQSKNTRNYFTHYDKALEKKALKGTALYYLTERLKIFLLILLLRETGFTNDQADTIITKGSNFLFNHLIHKDDAHGT